MDILTHQTASDYVKGVESNWGESGVVVRVSDNVTDATPDCPAIDVITESNFWTVWIECGKLYGEC